MSSNRVALPGYHRIAEAHEGSPAQVAEFERLDRQVHAWAKTVHKLELDPATANQPAKLMQPYQQMLNGLVAKAQASGTSIADSPVFVMNVSNWYDEAHHKLVVQVPGIDPVVLHRWAKLSYDTATHDVYVYLALDRGRPRQRRAHDEPNAWPARRQQLAVARPTSGRGAPAGFGTPPREP